MTMPFMHTIVQVHNCTKLQGLHSIYTVWDHKIDAEGSFYKLVAFLKHTTYDLQIDAQREWEECMDISKLSKLT